MPSFLFPDKKSTSGSPQSDDIPIAAISPRNPDPGMAVPAQAHLPMSVADLDGLRHQRWLADFETHTPHPSPYGSDSAVSFSSRPPSQQAVSTVSTPYASQASNQGLFEDVDIEAHQPNAVLQATPAPPRRKRAWDHMFTQNLERKHLYGFLLMAILLALYLAIMISQIVREIERNKPDPSAG